jgi:hypothetical protein
MRVKYNNQYINVINEADNPRKEFLAFWNNYYIAIAKEKLKTWDRRNTYAWYVQVQNPTGCYDYDGYYKNKYGSYEGTMSEALQDAFNNIDYPPIPVGGYADDIDEEDFRSEMRY